jgi:hypothetical protein
MRAGYLRLASRSKDIVLAWEYYTSYTKPTTRVARDKRVSKFEVPKTSNFGPRTVSRLTSRAFPASLARLA